MAGKRFTRKQVRRVARAICREASGCCVADMVSREHRCTRHNCRVIAVAQRALKEARKR